MWQAARPRKHSRGRAHAADALLWVALRQCQFAPAHPLLLTPPHTGACLQLPAAIMILLFSAFHLPAFSGQRLVAVAALLWGCAPAGLCLTYLLQLAFEVRARANRRTAAAVAVRARGASLLHTRLCYAARANPASHLCSRLTGRGAGAGALQHHLLHQRLPGPPGGVDPGHHPAVSEE